MSVARASSGSQNAASPAPPTGRSPLVYTGLEKMCFRSCMSYGSRDSSETLLPRTRMPFATFTPHRSLSTASWRRHRAPQGAY